MSSVLDSPSTITITYGPAMGQRNGLTFRLPPGESTIGSIKLEVEKLSHVPIAAMRIYYRGRTLRDADKLLDSSNQVTTTSLVEGFEDVSSSEVLFSQNSSNEVATSCEDVPRNGLLLEIVPPNSFSPPLLVRHTSNDVVDPALCRLVMMIGLDYLIVSNRQAAKVALATLLKVIDNIVSYPQVSKYYSIKKGNVTFHRKLGNIEGGKVCMLAAGFVENSQEGLYSFPNDPVDSSSLRARICVCQGAIRDRLEMLEAADQLSNTLNAVSSKVPQVSWVAVADTMASCAKCITLPAKRNDITLFLQECLWNIVDVMVSLNRIDGEPTSMTALENMWTEECGVKFKKCFDSGVSDIVRVMVRIGAMSSFDQLIEWKESYCSAKKMKRGTWVDTLGVLMDVDSAAYQSLNVSTNLLEPNWLWQTCSTAFFEEGGFNVLLNLLDTHVFDGVPADMELDDVLSFHCKLAGILKQVVDRHVTLSSAIMPRADEVHSANQAIDRIATQAVLWLENRYVRFPHKLANHKLWTGTLKQRMLPKDIKLIGCVMDLMNSESSLCFIQSMLSNSSFDVQLAGLCQLLEYEGDKEAKEAALRNFFTSFQNSVSVSLNVLVEQLSNIPSGDALERPVLTNMFRVLLKLMQHDKARLYQVWCDLGARCMCSSNVHIRLIGCELLLDASDSSPPSRNGSSGREFAPIALSVFTWFRGVCGYQNNRDNTTDSGFLLCQSLIGHGFTRDAESIFRTSQYLTTLHCVLIHTGCNEEAATIARLWMRTALRCLKSLDSYDMRVLGLMMIDDATIFVYGVHQLVHPLTTHLLARELGYVLSAQQVIESVLHALFSRGYANSLLIQTAHDWLLNVYYRECVYEDDLVDMMAYLVDTAVHPEWNSAAAEATSCLLIDITVTNISIKSLKSLCVLFNQAILNIGTSEAATSVVLKWIDLTRHKKWVLDVRERVLNLMWSMLLYNTSVQGDNQRKVFDMFKHQFE